MAGCIRLKKSNCRNCYKCIRSCPVKSIRFNDNQAYIIEEECVLCGRCFVVCPQEAKEIRDDTKRVEDMIAAGTKVYAAVAPSFVAAWDGVTWDTLTRALSMIGFNGAVETAEGAGEVARAYDAMIAENDAERDVIITTCCHTVNMLVQKHYPELISKLAPVTSPMQVTAMRIKQAHTGSRVVFIGPCISKKNEIDRYAEENGADVVLTFEEINEWFMRKGIDISTSINTTNTTNTASTAANGDSSQGNTFNGEGRLFPTAGGILKTMKCDNPQYVYMSVDGMDNCMDVLHDIALGHIDHCVIEMSACAGSCIGGPVLAHRHKGPARDFAAVTRFAASGRSKQTVAHTQPQPSTQTVAHTQPDELIVAHTQPDEQLPPLDISRKYTEIDVRTEMPGSKAIEEILRKMGKHSPADELNCGCCGYNSCRDKAIAVLAGKADLSMCLPFLKEKAESFSDTIIHNTPTGILVLSEELEIQQINEAACRMLGVKQDDISNTSLVADLFDISIFLSVMKTEMPDRDRKIYMEQRDMYLEQTVIYDRVYRIIMVLLRDITEEERARRNKEQISTSAVEITNKVIEKQMRVVQEIASLLGETTAETKLALTKLKETLSDD